MERNYIFKLINSISSLSGIIISKIYPEKDDEENRNRKKKEEESKKKGKNKKEEENKNEEKKDKIYGTDSKQVNEFHKAIKEEVYKGIDEFPEACYSNIKRILKVIIIRYALFVQKSDHLT